MATRRAQANLPEDFDQILSIKSARVAFFPASSSLARKC
jgi:hypothetical protein